MSCALLLALLFDEVRDQIFSRHCVFGPNNDCHAGGLQGFAKLIPDRLDNACGTGHPFDQIKQFQSCQRCLPRDCPRRGCGENWRAARDPYWIGIGGADLDVVLLPNKCRDMVSGVIFVETYSFTLSEFSLSLLGVRCANSFVLIP
ncbi:hypothetical protein CROQUDRAFT_101492 [Cronartium quercuum f. sp. fusiforme G11]|uniref:Secreted protein n=1 Tax=Cronartium quercuum f. sp. fusiforme G11 TaxID=708437 RepID=A0A9P6N5C2_9BASI|nr:hypothetical protein CROQUDRAFT_101492 [Cronartium quercuum f. sp. fusiforme G11]